MTASDVIGLALAVIGIFFIGVSVGLGWRR